MTAKQVIKELQAVEDLIDQIWSEARNLAPVYREAAYDFCKKLREDKQKEISRAVSKRKEQE